MKHKLKKKHRQFITIQYTDADNLLKLLLNVHQYVTN